MWRECALCVQPPYFDTFTRTSAHTPAMCVLVSDDSYVSLLMGLGASFTDTPSQGKREAYILSHHATASDLFTHCRRILDVCAERPGVW